MLQSYLEINPLISVILSISFFGGIYLISSHIGQFKFFIFLDKYFENKIFLVFAILLNLIMLSFYWLFLFFPINVLFIKIFSSVLVILGFFNILKIKRINIKFYNNYFFYLFSLLFVFFFLYSLYPITDPDSLDYHIGVPIYSLENSYFYIKYYWIHSQLAGAGEALTILNLSVNAIFAPTFIQFISLLLIIATFHFSKFKDFSQNSSKKFFIYILILSSPVLLFLVNTAKPQLISIACNFIAFFLAFLILPKEKNINDKKKIYLIIIFLTLSATQVKFSFLLSFAVIFLFTFYEMYKNKLTKFSFFSVFFFSLIILFPREFYEYLYINKNIFLNFFNPIPVEFISDSIKSSLKHGANLNLIPSLDRDIYQRIMPYWFFFALSPGEITYTLGLGCLIIFFNFKNKFQEVKKILYALLIFLIFGLYLGQPTGRFFVEPYLWTIVLGCIGLDIQKNKKFKFFVIPIFVQALSVLMVLIITSYNFLPGILSKEKYENVLHKFADGYDVFKWSNKYLPDNSVLLSTHRSMVFSKSKTVITDWRVFNGSEKMKTREHFINKLKLEKPTHILYVEHEHVHPMDIFKKCRGKLVKYGKDVGKFATRNPFNKESGIKYDAYIYEINYKDLDNYSKHC